MSFLFQKVTISFFPCDLFDETFMVYFCLYSRKVLQSVELQVGNDNKVMSLWLCTGSSLAQLHLHSKGLVLRTSFGRVSSEMCVDINTNLKIVQIVSSLLKYTDTKEKKRRRRKKKKPYSNTANLSRLHFLLYGTLI